MSVVLCFGDSNTWGFVPESFDAETGLAKRLEKDKRWPWIMQKELGEKYHVIEEALNGRTTALDEIDPGAPHKNGVALLPALLDTHYPIDIIVFMLGVNDTKIQYKRSAKEIAEGIRLLVRTVKIGNKGRDGGVPKILIIAPQPAVNSPTLHLAFDKSSVEKSEKFAETYQQVAAEESCEFLDASLFASSTTLDGIHIEEEGFKALGLAVAKAVRAI